MSALRRLRLPLSKIVATIGPASEELPVLPQVVDAGMRLMRLNFSHATEEEVELRMKNLALSPTAAPTQLGGCCAVVLDTAGPEVRTGVLRAMKESGNRRAKVTIEKGSEVMLSPDPALDGDGDASRLFVSYKNIAKSVSAGSKVLLDDGEIILEVSKVSGDDVHCVAENTGELGSRKGVNLPGSVVDLPAMADKDLKDLTYGLSHDMDYIAASFVRSAEGVREIREFAAEVVRAKFGPSHPVPLIISKIESQQALDNFDEILDESDAIMVARGDLGVEVPLQTVALWQKKIVQACNAAGKPVVVATQMLESMQKNPRATRAEVSDVTNAILDGADCVMLSGESANGQYPVESVAFMRDICNETEAASVEMGVNATAGGGLMPGWLIAGDAPPGDALSAAARSAVLASHGADATAILCLAEEGDSGALARAVAKFRPDVPVLVGCASAKVARQLQLHRALHPVVLDGGAAAADALPKLLVMSSDAGVTLPGDAVVLLGPEEWGGGWSLTSRIVTLA